MLKSQLSTSVIFAKVINESIRQLFLFKHVWYSARHNCFEAFQIGIRDSWCRYNKFLGPILSFFFASAITRCVVVDQQTLQLFW